MNAERLLALFEEISEAPDAITRLRSFILDLAVRGKLVEQDPGDERAEVLLKRLADAKQALIDSKLVKRPKPSRPITEGEMPIPLPKNWVWSRLIDIGRLAGGMTPSMSRPDYWDGDIPWLSPKDIKADEVGSSEMKITTAGLEETRLELYPPGSLFIVARSGILKRTLPVTINRVPAAANQDLKVLVPYLQGIERYLQLMLRGLADFLLRELVKTGTTVQSLKYAEFEQQPFPLPPVGEQQRIVAKVDELMALCDQLEAARQQREQCRERLVASSLQRLNQPSDDPEAFRSDARFALQVLPSFTTTPAQIKQLRQTILNLAVRGKLVEQDPEDEPAEDLLPNQRGKKTTPHTKKQPAVDDNEISDLTGADSLPSGWLNTSMGVLCSLITSGSRGWAEFYSSEGPGFIRAQNIRFGRMELSDLAHVQPPPNSEGSRTRVQPYDLLVVITGAGVTNPAMLDRDMGEAYVSQHVALIRPDVGSISPWLLHCLMANEGARGELTRCAYGSGKPGLNLSHLRFLHIPLPPLAEQHRIVAKVDELMALCDQLEMQLSQAEQSRRGLLEVVLREALEGEIAEATPSP